MKDTSETVCQRNSSETAQQNFVKLCSYEGHNVSPMLGIATLELERGVCELAHLSLHVCNVSKQFIF